MKAHVLIVEDESILYERMRRVLKKENYSIDVFTPSVNDAIARINSNRPDIVLLDIDLEGELTGIDLGKELSENYKIPFIYVTQYDDNETFYKGLNTQHQQFIVKTKPRLNTNEVLRAIQTVLSRSNKKESTFIKEGVLGLVSYLDEIREYNNGSISRIPVKFKEIAYFTISPFINENDEKEDVKTNYLWFLTNKKEYYFLKSSLKDLIQHLPYSFVRINDSYIVNIAPEILQGRINGSRLSIMNKELTIKSTYKDEVKKRFDFFYSS